MINIQPLNTDRNHCAPTVLAGYYKFGSRTLLLGDYGTTGGGDFDGIRIKQRKYDHKTQLHRPHHQELCHPQAHT